MVLNIEISWTASTSVSTTGYNVYLVAGAPESVTKTLLAFVAGISTTSYVYAGVDGTQYQFEVRATDGTNESPPLEIFYPNGTGLYTPTLLTPTGNPKQIVRDVAYLDKDSFLNYATGLKLTTSSALYTSGVLDIYLQAASELVNRYCRRHFNVQTIDETYPTVTISPYSPRMITVQLSEGPIQNINRVDLQVLKWFLNFDLSYLQLYQEEGYYRITPFLGGNASGTPLPGSLLTEKIPVVIWTNYTFGYDVIPDSVKMATSLVTTKLIGMQENPVSAQSVKFGRNFSLQWDKDNDPIMNTVKMLLEPYRTATYRRP